MKFAFENWLGFAIKTALNNREVKNRVYGKRQTANVRFAFMFSRKNEYMDENSAKITLAFGANAKLLNFA